MYDPGHQLVHVPRLVIGRVRLQRLLAGLRVCLHASAGQKPLRDTCMILATSLSTSRGLS